MLDDLRERLGASPRGEAREIVLRRFRQKEMVRVAYRDMSGLASAVEVSRELSDLAEACVLAALDWTRTAPGDPLNAAIPARLHAVGMGKLGSRQMHFSSDLDLLFLYDSPPAGAGPDERARIQQQKDDQTASMLEILSAVSSEGVTYPVDLRLRPEGSAGLLARSTESFLAYAGRFMQPWERMSLVRSRHLGGSAEDRGQWTALVTRIVYQYPWDDEALDSIRHLKRRIESEKNKESRIYLDFKYGRGGIADLEFLVQFLQIRFGSNYSSVRVPALNEAVQAMRAAGFLSAAEEKTILEAHQFQRLVENRYQLIEEWNSREISRESPVLARLARSLGFGGNSDSAVRKAFLEAWEDHAGGVRSAVDRLFYA
jgi:glutamate-ammonia-ligase adenylyltransferase